ncbi:MAG: DUF2029 domain-containing protein [Planctomycetes bacterium]|nr:DUF2029 domain-containing protein [Planctomycetota bacterium]
MIKDLPDRLPFSIPLPQGQAARRLAVAARIACYGVFIVLLVVPVVQFQVETHKNLKAGREYERKLAAGELLPNDTPPKIHKGAIGRWCGAFRDFWGGRNIYAMPAGSAAVTSTGDEGGLLHPNMPFTVILLSPFAYMPAEARAFTFNLLKIAVLVASLLMVARLASPPGRKIPDWVVFLGLVWAAAFLAGDIKHGNTNVFVLGAIALHLWLFRRGQNLAAGASLALAICLKMTPALFILYWLYQRNWRLLAGCLAGLAVAMLVVPAVALGPQHAADLTAAWYENLIKPGLIKGSWYPIHINQSIPAVFSRYFLAGPSGDAFWNPDDYPDYNPPSHGWITVLALPEQTVKLMVKLAQAIVALLIGWAIGWRKLPRDDGRRGLHYGLVALGMLLLNQRTWDHHAGILLLATMPAWFAVGYGIFSRRVRLAGLVLLIAAGLTKWLTGSEVVKLFAKAIGESKKGAGMADWLDAYGPTFFMLIMLLVCLVVLALALKKPADPYAQTRQKLVGLRPSSELTT